MIPFDRIVKIDKDLNIPVYRQIAVAIINAIRNSVLKAGTHLPGSRELAKILGVHRKTVIAAYEELNAQDWIVIVPRKQVSVAEHIPVLKPQDWSQSQLKKSYKNEFSLPFRTVEKSGLSVGITSVFDIIIDDGHPDVGLSPIDDLLKTYRTLASRKHSVKDAHIGTEQGTLKLRKELVSYLSETRGLNITAENILITHGAQMSIYLSSQLLLNNSTKIIIGKPNYLIANNAFKETGTNIIEVDVDNDGIDVYAIEELCKKIKIDAVYVIPHHHYPTTVMLSVERRMKLLELSNEFLFTIIEDDYDYDYHYSSSPYLPLASADHNGNVIYIGSFSKMLDPAIRIGFMVAPQNFVTQCTALRNAIDVGGDGYMQNALAMMIKDGELKRHIKKAKKIYHSRRDHLDTLLREKLGEYITYWLPTGGMAIWIKLLPQYPIGHLEVMNGLKIKRISIAQNAFRFGFASMDEKELENAVDLLVLQFQKFKAKEK
ncbi:PLP-dependent aminotransferase family protein [Pedobacter sp. MC2016-24]|uniref:MocR-like pyridoxine biosynthesis transcription factor PdxR n=1 Tax=Pedobacter sp. MC2016-24 TaxID=2780090 RepID=UPI001881BF32|nr:PLP-dependent aminotransferase family protein [Pedobacter sp. MC2016-24]MBE9601923.1 PLP-dependent aminotransferase family protein [Pedobacter sp. MC2016-24]